MSINFISLWLRMEFQNIVNFLDTTSDDNDLPRFATKKLIEVYGQSMLIKNLELKHQC